MSYVFDYAGLVASVLSILVVVGALVLWLRGHNPLVLRALELDRTGALGSVLSAIGVSDAQIHRAVRSCVRRYVDGDRAPDVQTELLWLDEIARSLNRPEPVSYFGMSDASSDRLSAGAVNDLTQLSRGYRSLALRTRGRGLLGGGTSPLFESVAEAADGVAKLLADNATFATGETGPSSNLRLIVHRGATRLELHNVRSSPKPGTGIDDIAAAYVARRLIVEGTASERVAQLDRIAVDVLRLSPEQHETLLRKFVGKTFDGVLPSIHASRVERDPVSGRTRLHCVLAETSFSAVMATSYPGSLGSGEVSPDLRGKARLLTLSILPVTSDGVFVLTRRSKHVAVAPDFLAPAVTGNLEMRQRFGVTVDRNSDGLHDPLLAIQRECREELGLNVERPQIAILGTMGFEGSTEVGSTVLLTTALLNCGLQDVADERKNADRVEGAWESSSELTGVPVPIDSASASALLAWTFASSDQLPHLTGSFVSYCYPILCSDLGVSGADEHIAALAERSAPAPPPLGIRKLHSATWTPVT